jgi:pimeloyl-ACP methyl ester carboxylesterase
VIEAQAQGSPARGGRASRFIVAALVFLAVGSGAFIVWGSMPLGAEPSALDALRSDAEVRVTRTAEGWVFAPAYTSVDPTTGLVFYPGGHVDARSYARLCRRIAVRGNLVVLTPMPLGLAALAPGTADAVLAAHPAVRNWSVGGHSLGGAMAAQFAAERISRVKGLALLAAYPPGGADLRASGLAVTSVYGSEDSVLRLRALDLSKRQLPEGTTWLVIAGGNHAGFGDYGAQPGDSAATIDSADQQEQAAAAIGGMLRLTAMR